MGKWLPLWAAISFACLSFVKKQGKRCVFLREHYGLTFDVDKNSYGEFIRKFIKE